MTTAIDRLLALLPVHVRARDEESGGTLRAVLTAVAGELDVIERDLDDLYEGWFVETAADWALPYLADLLGIDDLPGGPGRRAVVANTVDYRRRKGTPAVIEQVARDVTGWPTRAVEYYRLLATATHVNHVRLDRPAVADVRHAVDLGATQIAHGSLDPAMHTADVRRIASGRGRYGIGNIGVFSYALQVYAVDRAPAVPASDAGGWWVHPLAVPTPLFALPADEDTIEHLAGEPDLPLPLRARRLLTLLRAARAGTIDPKDLPFEVSIDVPEPAGVVTVAPDRMRVCGLEDLLQGPATISADGAVTPGPVPDGWQVMVDAVTGHLATHCYRSGTEVPPDDEATAGATVHVRYCYGGTADVGAGTYDRTEVHQDALAVDGYVRARDVAYVAQHAVHLEPREPRSTQPAPPSLPQVLDVVAHEWAGTAQPGGSVPTTGSTTVVSIADSGAWTGDLTIEIPVATRLVLVAADWPSRLLANGEVLPAVPGEYAPAGLRPHLRGTLTVTGAPGSALVVDGLLLEGDLVVTAGSLAALTISQATVTGTVQVRAGSRNRNNDLQVRLVRAAVGRVALAATVPKVDVVDTIVSREVAGAAVTGAALSATGAYLSVTGSTLRGAVEVRTLDAGNAIFDGHVDVAHRQVGCVRYCYVGPGSRAPRRFRCVPPSDTEAAPAPVYISDQPGSPSFLALAPGCPAAIRAGAELGAEMGVHYHLQRPVRLAAAERLLAGYLPAGLEIGVVRDG